MRGHQPELDALPPPGSPRLLLRCVRLLRPPHHLKHPHHPVLPRAQLTRPTPPFPCLNPGGWVGYTSYDTIRYVYKDKLRFEDAPVDDRNLPDIALGLYKEVVVFDQATKLAYAVEWISTRSFSTPQDAYAEGQRRLAGLVARLQADKAPTLQAGAVTLNLKALPPPHATSNMTKSGFLDMVAKAKEHIKARFFESLSLSLRLPNSPHPSSPDDSVRCASG